MNKKEVIGFLDFTVKYQEKMFIDRPFHPLKWFLKNMKLCNIKGYTEIMEQKHCINNSIDIMFIDQAEYWEGFFCEIFPMPHAWNKIDDRFIDNTITDRTGKYWGIKIPSKLLIMATENKYWKIHTGVLETMNTFSNEDLQIAKEILNA